TRDGTALDVEISSHGLDFSGRRARLVMAIDVTDRRRSEAALRSSEERYRDLVENANDIIFTMDTTGRLVSANLMAELVTGYSRRELEGTHYEQLVAPEHQRA